MVRVGYLWQLLPEVIGPFCSRQTMIEKVQSRSLWLRIKILSYFTGCALNATTRTIFLSAIKLR